MAVGEDSQVEIVESEVSKLKYVIELLVLKDENVVVLKEATPKGFFILLLEFCLSCIANLKP